MGEETAGGDVADPAGGYAAGSHAQSERWVWDYELVPRLEIIEAGTGYATRVGENVKLYLLNFTFAEILPKYPPPA